MEESELLAPAQYDVLWLIIAIGLVVIAGLFYSLMFFFTKKMRPEDDVTPLAKMALGAERLSLIKNKYVEEIKEIEQQHLAGDLSSRKAFQKLSICLRNFTHEYSNSGAFSMTLSDLEQQQAPQLLVEKIRNYYPLAFQEAERTGNVQLAVQDALKVVQLWH